MQLPEAAHWGLLLGVRADRTHLPLGSWEQQRQPHRHQPQQCHRRS